MHDRAGETDPNELYIAVGMAIHAWESMELALARLYFKFKGVDPAPHEYIDYGTKNAMLRNRITALSRTAEAYFVKAPDQTKEAEFDDILRSVELLSIRRHRIAHGYVSISGALNSVSVSSDGLLEISGTMLYRWATPFYAVEKLKTDIIGFDSNSIHSDRALFENLHNRVIEFIEKV